MIPATAKAARYGAKVRIPSGAIGSRMRTKPYVPIFRRTPARRTEPTVGAAVWASGSQLCSGHIGVFTASPRPIARTAMTCTDVVSPRPLSAASATMSNVPAFTPTRSRPSSMTTEPSSV